MKQQNIKKEKKVKKQSIPEKEVDVESMPNYGRYSLTISHDDRYMIYDAQDDMVFQIPSWKLPDYEPLFSMGIEGDEHPADLTSEKMEGIYFADKSEKCADVEVSSFSDAFPKINNDLEYSDPLDVQVEGDYYKQGGIQPIEYIHSNKLGYIEGCVVKYITRYKFKNNGKDCIKDLKKIKHYIDLLIKLEYGQDNN